MDTIITVDNISKRYRIGIKEELNNSLVDSIASFLESPFKKLRQIRNLSRFSKNENNNDIIWALKKISFEVKKGEILGIIGRNGSGKSTLLKILSRITIPTSGSIVIEGRVASLLEVGTGFHSELSGRENIFLNGAILGMKKDEIKKKFDEIVDFSGVEKFIDTPVKRYSSGMYVRLAFAVAAHMEPDILVIDEVLSVGDAEFQRKCLGKMKNVSGQGRTVLFVSHNMAVIKILCTRSLYLSQGEAIHVGSIDDAIKNYLGYITHINLQRIWDIKDAPGNSGIKVIEIALLDNENHFPAVIIIAQPFKFRIKFLVIKDGTIPIFSFSIHNSAGDMIFGSISNRIKDYPNTRYNKGEYFYEVVIPENFLNNGQFYVNFNGYCKNYTEHFPIDSPICFEASDDGVLLNDYRGNFGGFIRPKLQWSSSIESQFNGK